VSASLPLSCRSCRAASVGRAFKAPSRCKLDLGIDTKNCCDPRRKPVHFSLGPTRPWPEGPELRPMPPKLQTPYSITSLGEGQKGLFLDLVTNSPQRGLRRPCRNEARRCHVEKPNDRQPWFLGEYGKWPNHAATEIPISSRRLIHRPRTTGRLTRYQAPRSQRGYRGQCGVTTFESDQCLSWVTNGCREGACGAVGLSLM
jgi:hypothetical protein